MKNDILLPEVASFTEAEMTIRKELIKKYNVRQMTDGRWRAVFFIDGEKHDIRRTKYEDLISYVCTFDAGETQTINSIWTDFIEHSKAYKRAGTIQNYESIYTFYFRDSRLFEMPLKAIKKADIEAFCIDCISIKPLKMRYWKSILGVISQVFIYADLPNPTKNLRLSPNLFIPATHKRECKKAFSLSEKERLKNLAIEYAKRYQEPRYLGIILTFCIGVRVAELCALKWSDIEDDILHVQREIIDRGTGIVDSTKTPSGDRYIPLNSKALDTLKRIKDLNTIKGITSDFIFVGIDGEYAKPYNFDKMIRRLERRLGFTEIKSMHDIRRTFATELYQNGVSVKQIQKLMGHSNIAQTYAYIMALDEPISLENIG